MKQKIQLSIPEPCHENWQQMSSVEKGRFCSSCQKTVLDFTQLSDNEIIKLVSKNDNLCGRFNASQLDRNLIGTKRTSNYFGYFTTSVLAFLGLGAESAVAQEKPTLEQNIIRKSTNLNDSDFLVRGIVKDTLGKGIANMIIHVYGQKDLKTNANGEFEIFVKQNQRVVFYDTDDEFGEFECRISDNSFLEIVLENNVRRYISGCTVGFVVSVSENQITKKRSFFGRTFHKIGNWFR